MDGEEELDELVDVVLMMISTRLNLSDLQGEVFQRSIKGIVAELKLMKDAGSADIVMVQKDLVKDWLTEKKIIKNVFLKLRK